MQKKIIKTLYESRDKFIKLFSDYSKIASEAKHKKIMRRPQNILNPTQMFYRLPVALVQVKAGNTSQNLLNETTQIIYLCSKKKKSLKKHITT